MIKFVCLLLSVVAIGHSVPAGRPTRSKVDLDLLLDDIKFPPGFDKSGVIGSNYRWPNRQVAYEIDPAYTQDERNTILAGINEVSSKTCITFAQRTSQADYVFLQRGYNTGCNSYVGRQGGRQIVNLQVASSPGGGHCIWVGTVAHELIHAIGYYHEQSRTDRDDYVTILWDNIEPAYQYAYDKYPATMIDPFGVSYDHQSIMHYKDGGFAIDPSKSTIISKPPGITLGGDVLTQKDIQKINNMYQC